MKKFLLLQSLLLLMTADVALGQRGMARPAPISKIAVERRMERQAEAERRQAEIESRLKRDPAETKKNYLPAKPKRTKEQDAVLQPDAENLNKYAAFLQQPKTGMIRLMPDKGCQSDDKVVRAAEHCSKYIPGSSFYSFREKEYTLESLADIGYRNGLLISNPLYAQGVMTMLGDIPLENVSLENEGIKIISQYQPATDSESALKQFAELSKGIINGKHLYRNAVPVGENITYALRVIAYRGEFYRTLLEEDERKDVILAFRIVRNEKDNGLTLLWKEFSRKDSPRLINAKDEKTAIKAGM